MYARAQALASSDTLRHSHREHKVARSNAGRTGAEFVTMCFAGMIFKQSSTFGDGCYEYPDGCPGSDACVYDFYDSDDANSYCCAFRTSTLPVVCSCWIPDKRVLWCIESPTIFSTSLTVLCSAVHRSCGHRCLLWW